MPLPEEYIVDSTYRHQASRASALNYRISLTPNAKFSYVHVRPLRPTMNGSVVSWRQPGELHDIWNMPSPPAYSGRHGGMGSRTNPVSPRPRVHRILTERPFSSGEDRQISTAHRRRGSSFTPTKPKPLSELPIANFMWPPRGLTLDSLLMPREAQKLVCHGASTFKGWLDPVPHTSSGLYRLYAVMNESHDRRSDKADVHGESFRAISLTVTGNKTSFPWLCLEQPSMATRTGKYPGTMSLNYHVGLGGCLDAPVSYGTDVRPRPRSLFALMDRLVQLQKGLETDTDKLYGQLYGKLIHDPDADSVPHIGMEQQISDLITVLSNPDWIDFSHARNQVLAKYFDAEDEPTRRHFFHQLLLATELYLRIHRDDHDEKAKRKLLLKLPPKIAWDLAVAQRWRENMSIKKKDLERKGKVESKFTFVSKTKARQKEAMKIFASTLKWPNMDEIKYVLAETDDKELALEDRSADTASWFFGPLLPGQTLPWILMNALIDCDRDTQGALQYLTHLHPASGFQYRNNTYWSNSCIVGKVLGAARGVNELAGWVGPCISTTDLKRTECARIQQQRPLEPLPSPGDCQAMQQRSDPLGPERLTSYPVDAFDLVVPDTKILVNNVRVQRLRLDVVEHQPVQTLDGTPLLWKPVIDFAFGSRNVPLWLRHCVNFIAAYPCENGPHVLFSEYKYRAVRTGDELIDVYDWSRRSRTEGSYYSPILEKPTIRKSSRRKTTSPPRSPVRSPPATPRVRGHARHQSTPTTAPGALRQITDGRDYSDRPHVSSDPSTHSVSLSTQSVDGAEPAESPPICEVLVIEAFGVSDNEVLARAWCSYEGVSAIVANVHETCMACAIREAVAACVSVVILTAGGSPDEEDEGVRA